ncbi:hypothetical protein, partial [Lentibacillus kapialis]|uniref:hypothetical protein n=1 Tax=Lentibacillus kapialis TaxID=340214 RepID=UPI001E5D1F6F
PATTLKSYHVDSDYLDCPTAGCAKTHSIGYCDILKFYTFLSDKKKQGFIALLTGGIRESLTVIVLPRH